MRLATTILILLFITLHPKSQNPRFDRFDILNGLSSNNINDLEIDDLGNIWVGTLDGVNRYNGYSFDLFKPFHNTPGHLTGNDILALGRGFDGNMWVTTRGGRLHFYDAATNRFSVISDTLFQRLGIAPLQHLTQANDSLLWFSDHSALGVLNIHSHKVIGYQAPDAIMGLHVDQGRLLINGLFGILSITLNQRSAIPTIKAQIISQTPCYHLQYDNGRWYSISDRGIVLMNPDFSSNRILLLFADLKGSLLRGSNIKAFAVHNKTFWFGGRDLLARAQVRDSLYSFESFHFDAQNPYSFKGYNVTHLKFDKLGNLWIGTDKNGLNHFNNQKNQFLLYNGDIQTMNNPGFDPVRAICKTRQGDLWMGFDRQGVGVLPLEGPQRFYLYYYTKENKQQIIRNVRTLFQDSEGNLWMGASNQLCLYNLKRDRFETVDCKFSWNWPFRCYCIKELEPGTVTLTASPNIGFLNLRTGQLTTLPQIKGKTGLSGTIRDLAQDKYRNLWMAKDNNGIQKIIYPNLEYEIINTETHQLSDNKVYCMLASGDSLWIGTNAGLNLFSISKNKIIRYYFESDGLSNNVVYSINMDNNHNLWMSTNKGISHLNVSTGHFTNYLPNDVFMDDAHFTDNAGNIYYGGYSGVISFHPSTIQKPEKKLNPVLESFSLFNKPVFPGDTINGRVILSHPLSTTRVIELKHYQNVFSIGFNAFPFDYPNTNTFRYRLKGLQEQWVYSDGRVRQASYTVVPPGDYLFQIEAASNQQAFGQRKELRIEVIPPFYQTPWFKVLMSVVALLLLLAGYRIRMRQIRRQNRILQSRVEAQTAELRAQNNKIKNISEKLHEADQSKLRFFTNLSHEFRTPLTLILGHLENLEKDKHNGTRIIRNNALRLLRLVNQLLDLRKLDQQKLQLTISTFDLIPFTSEIVNSFKVMARQKNIQLTFLEHPERLIVWLDQDKMEKILYNLISNALQYTPQNKSVEVSIQTDVPQNHFRLTVKDQGIGLSQEEQQHIFERFYRSKNGQNISGGHGIGMAIVKGLSDIQKGVISLNSEPNKGTRIEITFPIQNPETPPSRVADNKPNSLLSDQGEMTAVPPTLFTSLGGKKILIVEDNHELSLFLADLLQDTFTLKRAENGREALGVLNDFTPDLIISDIMMPQMDGIEFCKTVKKNIETSHIPFILLTAKADQETRIEGFELGIDDFIEKPFNSQMLLVRIKALLENRDLLKKHFEKLDGTPLPSQGMSKTDQHFMLKVNQSIEAGYTDPLFNMEKLSEQVCMSRSTFYRKFSGLTGMGPADYLRKIRLKRATTLLNNQSTPISQIAEEVGFQSTSHFRKCFKEEYGETPGAWRKQSGS